MRSRRDTQSVTRRVSTAAPPAERGPPAWLLDVERLDAAVFATITQTPTPALDWGMSRLTTASNYSRLWLGSAAILATTRGQRGRRAALWARLSRRLVRHRQSADQRLGQRRRPDPSDVPADRRAPVPASTSFLSGHSASAFAFATGVERFCHARRSQSGRSPPLSRTRASTPGPITQPTSSQARSWARRSHS